MAHNSSRDPNSDMDLDMLEESEDELNITTNFHDNIEESSTDSDSNEGESLEDGGRKESPEAVDSGEKLAEDHTEVPINVVDGGGATESLEAVDKIEKLSLDVDYTEVPMDIMSPPETKTTSALLHKVVRKESLEVVRGGGGTESLEVVDTEVPMDITSPLETKKNHLILCLVCFEIAILCKYSTLYDNLINACMEQRSRQ